MERGLQIVIKLLPLIFGIGFLAPVIAAGMIGLGITDVVGLSPLHIGLVIGGAWGLFATVTGRWL